MVNVVNKVISTHPLTNDSMKQEKKSSPLNNKGGNNKITLSTFLINRTREIKRDFVTSTNY
jgi:hypothetical protein